MPARIVQLTNDEKAQIQENIKRANQQKGQSGSTARPTAAPGNRGPILPLPGSLCFLTGHDKRVSGCDNFSLLFNRYLTYPSAVNWDYNNKDDVNGTNGRPGSWAFLEKQAGQIFTSTQCKEISTLLKTRRERLAGLLPNTEQFTRTTAWRLVIGQGYAHPLENGLTLHRNYGIPYLPGSGIKGVTMAWQLDYLADQLGVVPSATGAPMSLLEELLRSELPAQDSESHEQLKKIFGQLRRLTEDPNAELHNHNLESLLKFGHDFRLIFGGPQNRGRVVFMDAFPEIPARSPLLVQDIINPHFQEYYGENSTTPPADYLEPNPCRFLTIGSNVPFSFFIHGSDGQAVQKAVQWCKNGLKEFGIGGKTSAGYGELITNPDH
jgi:CRISPR-associated protein Cmr6